MIRTADDVNRMANLLALKIENRRPDIRKHTDYVRGKRGTLKFASDEFKRYMADRFSGFADNFISGDSFRMMIANWIRM